ncbi:penicillin acylase family protein [Bdellovibrio bacteriovorus]|nr:penicillin acylase family protein [Bdellovibrio bacteriovorus]
MKNLKRILLVLTALICIAVFVVYFFMKQSVAPMDGQLKLEGLSAPVTITRDTFGIPHIKAQNKIDALRALGFVMASERLFQMELSRRMTQGELSEAFGDVAVTSDKLYRSLMIKPAVERMLKHEKETGTFDERLWSEMEAYFDGVNQYVATRPLPFEMKTLGLKPRPFTPMDAYVMTGHMAYSFGIALKADPLMSELAKKLSEEQFQALRNNPLTAPLKIVSNSLALPALTEGLFTPHFEGSNAWLIAPSRSQSGKSIFANDPHIGYALPAVWVEAHIQTPEFELYGHYLPLVPFAILGHNRHHAWGFTMSLSDDMDLYRETLDTEKKTVLFNKKPVSYQEWNEVIKVKDGIDVTLPMIETPHGPLMDGIFTEKNLALKWAFHRKENNPMKALRMMGEAKSMAEFESALKSATAPGLNVMYADADNIAWWIFGDIAVKKNPNSDMLLDGASGDDEYLRLLEWNEKPHSVNPPSGFIVTANSRPESLPTNIRGDFQADDRYQTIVKALSEKDVWNAEEFKALQTDNYNAFTPEILEKLLADLHLSPEENKKYEKALQDLKDWNHRSDISSTAASLYHQWNSDNIQLLLQKLSKEERQTFLNTPYAWQFYRRTILNETAPWWKDLKRPEVITAGFKKAIEKVQNKTWGEIHTVEYIHPLGRTAPLNKVFNLGPYPIPGAYNEINNNKMRGMGGDFKVVAGPSTRRIIDFASPQKSWGINPIGISGHMLSPFYKDQVHLFIEGKYREQWMDDKDIEQVKTHVLTLE